MNSSRHMERDRDKYDIPRYIPGEDLLLKEVVITQGILFILIFAMLVFLTENLYLKFIEYILIIWYIVLWTLKTLRDG